MTVRAATLPARRLFTSKGYRTNTALALSIAFLVALLILTVFAPLFAPYSPVNGDILHTYAGPSGKHWLGTDEVGRDVLSRLIYAGRTSLLAGLWATAIAGIVGVALGLVAGYRGGFVDQLFSRGNDTLLSVPGIVLAMAFIAILGPGWFNAMTAVGIIFIPRFYRVARSASKSAAKAPYVEALVSVGAPPHRILLRHVLPNIMSPIIVESTVVFSAAILSEAALSFLGLGVQPPTPSWGVMLSTAQSRPSATNLLYPAGIILTLTILSISIVTDHLRDFVSGVRRRGVA